MLVRFILENVVIRLLKPVTTVLLLTLIAPALFGMSHCLKQGREAVEARLPDDDNGRRCGGSTSKSAAIRKFMLPTIRSADQQAGRDYVPGRSD